MHTITTHEAPATGLRGIADTSWKDHGACVGIDPQEADETFFARPSNYLGLAEAKQICSHCSVRNTCFQYAIENDITDGVWGGLTAQERRLWHRGLPDRLNYTRIRAAFQGRDVHLSAAEKQVVVDHAYVRGWRADRLALVLKVSAEHARDLLRRSANKIAQRDLGTSRLTRRRRSSATDTPARFDSSAPARTRGKAA